METGCTAVTVVPSLDCVSEIGHLSGSVSVLAPPMKSFSDKPPWHPGLSSGMNHDT